MLCTLAFRNMFEDMLSSATEQYYGHLVLAHPNYHQRRDMFAHLPQEVVEAAPLQQTAEIEGRSPRLRSFGLLSRMDSSQPCEVMGVIPQLEQQVTTLHEKITQGRHLVPDDPNGIVLGEGLARKLELAIGDEAVFVTQSADGSIGNDLLYVRGIFATGDSWLQATIALEGRIHEVAMAVNDPMQAAAIADRVNAALIGQVEILDWGDLLPEMREAIAAYDVSRMIMVIILYLATGLGILNTFFMSVMERTREFGILMAQGMSPWSVRRLVMLETLLMGCIALLIGLLLGALMTFYMATVGVDLSGHITPVTYAGGTILPRLHAVFEPGNFYVPAGMLLVVCLAAGFLPANRAARLNPVVAIREE
jgi:ABC-type lipoprotein release transport system permease subunit